MLTLHATSGKITFYNKQVPPLKPATAILKIGTNKLFNIIAHKLPTANYINKLSSKAWQD